MLQGNNLTQHYQYHTITYNIMQYYTCTAQTKNKQMQQLKKHNFIRQSALALFFGGGKGRRLCCCVVILSFALTKLFFLRCVS